MMAETKALLQNEALADDRSSQSGYRHSAAIANFASDPGDANYTFRWNNKRCIGSEIHNIVAGDICEDDSDDAEVIQAVERVLVADPSQITKRFTWTTYWKGRRQECSGEAIHIAAARGSCALVKLLLKRGARVDSCIMRDASPNYDVLHAAIFGEGVGGSEDVVEMLLDNKAQMSYNADNLSPLHIAFKTGKVELIRKLQAHMHEYARDIYNEIHDEKRATVAVPLEYGVTSGALSVSELAKLAPRTATSLSVFLKQHPYTIPKFLIAAEQEEEGAASKLAKEMVEMHEGALFDIMEVLRMVPKVALCLIEVLTATPVCEHPSWHALPKRSNFASDTIGKKLRVLVNPPPAPWLKEMYVEDSQWTYDVKTKEAPRWHDHFGLSSSTERGAFRDIEVKVCYLKNLVCAEFMSALLAAPDEEQGALFANKVIQGALQMAWWHGAVRVDLAQWFVSVWALILLVCDGKMLPQSGLQEGWDAAGQASCSVSIAFIGARAVVDLLHELCQVMGYFRVGREQDYLNMGNFYDCLRCILPILMFIYDASRSLRTAVILICWMRLLEINFFERIAREALPIKRLAGGLVPALIITLLGFMGLTNAMYSLDPDAGGQTWSGNIKKNFAMLIIGDLPELEGADELTQLICYSSVLIFTIFFLNIFIGIIGENYTLQKERSHEIFQEARTEACLAYLLRAKAVPSCLCSTRCAVGLAVVGAISAIVVQATSLSMEDVAEPLCVANGWALFGGFFVSQAMILLAAYQDPSAPWSACRKKDHYLWIAVADESWLPGEADSTDVQACRWLYQNDPPSPIRRNRLPLPPSRASTIA